ncbi:MAG: flavodoxin family protein [Candidatus Gracilibacteria bacterium]
MEHEAPAETLIIDGSPRAGNTQYVCERIKAGLDHPGRIIKVFNQKILPCTGCMACNKKLPCGLDKKDDMPEIREAIANARVLVVGAPNYWDGVPGHLRTMIDRLNPFFGDGHVDERVYGMPYLQFMVGGRADQDFCIEQGLGGLKRHLGLQQLDSYYSQAVKPRDLRKQPEAIQVAIDDMIRKINAAVAASKR